MLSCTGLIAPPAPGDNWFGESSGLDGLQVWVMEGVLEVGGGGGGGGAANAREG